MDNNRKDLVLEMHDAIRTAEYNLLPITSRDKLSLDQADPNWRGMRDTELAASKYMRTHGPGRYSPLPMLYAK